MTPKSPPPSDLFFDYSPISARVREWPVFGSGAGFAHVPPETVYPPGRHPEDHQFTWERGRVLHEYQMVYVAKGRGRFESAESKPTAVTADTVFLLFPGVWHRYQPDRATGWSEFWIELQGRELKRLREQGLIDPRRPVYRHPFPQEVRGYFQEALQLTQRKPRGFQVRLGLLGLQVLAALEWSAGESSSPTRRIERLVGEAQTMIARDQAGDWSPEALARQLGVGYSYFRRNFKRQTGFTPKQYQAELRLRAAKNLLGNTDLTIEAVAEQLGYCSPYHLSLDFSRRVGVPPSTWRKTAAATPP